MGIHNSNCSQLNYTMKVFAFAIVLALSIQHIQTIVPPTSEICQPGECPVRICDVPCYWGCEEREQCKCPDKMRLVHYANGRTQCERMEYRTLLRNEQLRTSQGTIDSTINAAVDGICNCATPIPQLMNSLYNAGESCLMSLGLGAPASATALCTATALGLLNEDGSVASIDPFKAAHGGSNEFDAALDDCYADSFDAIDDVVEASKAFGICIELTIADMCNIPLARHELLLTTEAMSRDLCN